MSEKNTNPIELTDEQVEKVSGGVSMLRSATTDPLQEIPTRISTGSNVLRQDGEEEDPKLKMSSALNRPRPRQ